MNRRFLSEAATQTRKTILRPRKAVITLTSNALIQLNKLKQQNAHQLLKINVRQRGCSGNEYHLEYVSDIKKTDEIVDQDGVRVLVESKALLSLIGSEMDYVEDVLSSKFIFNNPNVTGSCGCGESFMTD